MPNKCKKVSVLFFGNDGFSANPLKTLYQHRENLLSNLAVVCSNSLKNDKKGQKDSEVKVIAEQHNIPLIPWDNIGCDARLSQYDLAIVASFGHFIPSKLIKKFKLGGINIHPSLLPRWRGSAPIIHTILAGDKETGISIIELSKKKFDVGKILYQQKYKVPEDCTSNDLQHQLSKAGAELLPYVLKNLDQLRLNAIDQNEELVTLAKKIKRSDGYVDFSCQNCTEIQRLFRAISNKVGIQAMFGDKKVKFANLKRVEVVSDDERVGTCTFNKKENILKIKCLNGWICVDELQVEAKKKKINAASFYNGYIIDKKTGKPSKERFHLI